MNSVATYENHSNGFSAQSDFSATVGSACSSEEMLYRVFSDNMFLEEDNTKKTVKFGDVFVEDEAPLYEADSSNDGKGNLLLSMFAHTHEKDAKAFSLHSNGSASGGEEEPLDPKDNYNWYSNYAKEIGSDFSVDTENPSKDVHQLSTQSDDANTVREKQSRVKVEGKESQQLPNTKSQATPDIRNREDSGTRTSAQSSPKTSKVKKKASRQKAILKEQNQKLIDQTLALSSCISVQQQTIDNYESLVTDIQKDFSKLKANYELSVRENVISGQNLEAAVQAFENTKLQLDALSRIKDLRTPDDNNAAIFGNFFAYSEQNYEIMRNLIYELQYKNNCLDEVCTLLSKKMNSMYRYTIAPALRLASGDFESSNEMLSFDSNNSIQEYMDANFAIFENVQKLTRVGEKAENYENKKKLALAEIEKYFDHLNSLVVDQLEELVRRKT